MDELARILEQFRTFDVRHRVEFLARLSGECSGEEIEFFAGSVAAGVSKRRDFVAFFPDELVVEIFSSLGYKHMCFCSAVSREWKRLADDPLLWKWLSFREYGSTLAEPSAALRAQLTDDWKSNFRCLKKISVLNELAGWFQTALITDGGRLYMTGNCDSESIQLDMPTNSLVPVYVKEMESYHPVATVSVCYTHFVAVAGQCIFTWGVGDCGQLGHGDRMSVSTPRMIESLIPHRLLHVSAGRSHTCATTSDGALFTWGLNNFGQLGHGNSDFDLCSPRQVMGLQDTKIVAVAADSHTLALSDSGAVFSWGCGAHGRLGHSGTANLSSPKLVDRLRGKRVVNLSAGFEQSLALTAQGTVYAWGCGLYGRLGHGDDATVLVPKKLNFGAGAVVCVSTGLYHSAIVTDAGSVYTFGQGAYNQLGHGGMDDQFSPKCVSALLKRKIICVSCGGAHTVAISASGVVFVWGYAGGGRTGIGEISGRSVVRPLPIRSLKGRRVHGLSTVPPY